MTFATLISFVLGATLDIILLSYGARRLLAERRFSLSRTIVAGLAGQALTNAIFNALAAGLHESRLPPEFTAELGRLQDRVSPLPWAQIEQVLQEELGGTGLFGQIDREPLAAASIAQVHAAAGARARRW